MHRQHYICKCHLNCHLHLQINHQDGFFYLIIFVSWIHQHQLDLFWNSQPNGISFFHLSKITSAMTHKGYFSAHCDYLDPPILDDTNKFGTSSHSRNNIITSYWLWLYLLLLVVPCSNEAFSMEGFSLSFLTYHCNQCLSIQLIIFLEVVRLGRRQCFGNFLKQLINPLFVHTTTRHIVYLQCFKPYVNEVESVIKRLRSISCWPIC